MRAAQRVRGETGGVVRTQEVDDILAEAIWFVDAHVADSALSQLLTEAISGLEIQLQDDKALLPFVHLPLAVFAAIRGESAPARPLAVATTLLFLGIDILDDIADGDLPPHWQGTPESEIQLVASTLLASLPQLAIAQLDVLPLTKTRMITCLSESLLRMGGGQLHDLRGAGKELVRPEDVEQSVEHKSGEEGALIAMLAAHMAGASEETVQIYGDFGRALATGGQIATDCFDLFQADHSKDLANGSRTLPIAIYLSRLQGADRAAFLSQLDEARTTPAMRTLVQRELRAKGMLRLCALVVEMYCQKARDALDQLSLAGLERRTLDYMVAHVSFFSHKE